MENLYTKDDTIFVQIASYRDPELQHTLQDLFKKAKRPENIFVGICHQYDMKDGADKHLFEVPFPRVEQLRIDEVDYRETKGMCWARNRSQKLWQQEKWSLRLDAHHRFKESWDEELVNAVYDLNKKGEAIISQCPPGYNPKTEEKDMLCSNRIRCERYIGTYAVYKTSDYPKNPNLTIFNYGCFIFGLSKFVVKSLINPFMDNLDEVPFSITNWTKGADIYSYHKPVIWHYWPEEEESEKNQARKEYRTTTPRALSLQDDLLRAKKNNDKEIINFSKEYPVGEKRTLFDYQRFSGVNFRAKKVREHAKQGAFEDWQEVIKINMVKKIFNKQK